MDKTTKQIRKHSECLEKWVKHYHQKQINHVLKKVKSEILRNAYLGQAQESVVRMVCDKYMKGE